ncbi:hypothetical protein [Thalassospira lohafexi]|uniref:Uncharacterized protein n=1 Tax=Thalassospira lohafexi TaxID=744227 RepID=A0A2N3L0Q5_9PROT|nr:hypothetical protein [Thalassospira lohafexi]PKR56381.1 hypothetical protein COO92_21490 [Thalassospira lohafexi]
MNKDMTGHNNPPSAIDELEQVAGDLYAEANNWADGTEIADDEQAGAVSDLINMIRDHTKKVEGNRKAEKQPHMDAAKAVDETHKPIKESLDRAAGILKSVLLKWQTKKEAEQRAEAERLRKLAEEEARKAQEAIQQRETLEDAELAEQRVKEAKRLEQQANAAAKANANSKGSVGRAVSMRTKHVATVTDYKAAAGWLWQNRPGCFSETIEKLVQQEVNRKNHSIPGVEITEERSVA